MTQSAAADDPKRGLCGCAWYDCTSTPNHRCDVSYLGHSAFSRAGIVGQLSSEYGEAYPLGDAEFAVARLEAEGGVDWNAEAAEAAASYLSHTAFSRQGLLDQLTSQYGEQFTPEQAEYGVSTTGL